MPLRESAGLTVFGERDPLINAPTIWRTVPGVTTTNSEGIYRSKRKDRFQWILFIGITALSILLLFIIFGAMQGLDDDDFVPITTTTTAPFIPPMTNATTESTSTTPSPSTSTPTSTTLSPSTSTPTSTTLSPSSSTSTSTISSTPEVSPVSS